jgi:small-conductance mechanosensitive channel
VRRLRPLGILLALLLFVLGLCAIAWVGLREDRLPSNVATRTLDAMLFPVGIAAAGTLSLFVLFRAGTRHLAHRNAARDLQSLSALETVAVVLVVVFLVAETFGSFAGTVLSLGLVGFGLTLALQRPILAVGGWSAILFARLFRVGDRIEVDKMVGDVLEINLFTTRLWEVDVLTGRATGRTLTVSNALFVEKPVANATADVAVVFDEFAVNVAYGSDLRAAEALLRRVGGEVLAGPHQEEMASRYEAATEGLPIETAFPRAPVVIVALQPAGVELRLRYLVDARHRSQVRTALAETWLKTLGDGAGAAVPRIA